MIVAGKGGVGKTTVTAVLARAAADAGLRVLVVELDGKPALDELVPDIAVRHISAADPLEEYLLEHGFKRIAKRLSIDRRDRRGRHRRARASTTSSCSARSSSSSAAASGT